MESRGVNYDNNSRDVNVHIENPEGANYIDTETVVEDEDDQLKQDERSYKLRELLQDFRFPDESGLDLEAENRLGLEHVLRAMNFHGMLGFRSQIQRKREISITFNTSSQMGEIKASLKNWWGCMSPCQLRKVNIRLNNRKALYLTYRRQFCSFFNREPFIVDIFLYDENVKIGSIITHGKSFGEDGVILDNVARSTFMISKFKPIPRFCLKFPRILFSDKNGVPMALAAETNKYCPATLAYPLYKLKYCAEAANESASTKAVITAGFVMWLLTRRQENQRRGLWYYLFLQLIVFFVCLIHKIVKIITTEIDKSSYSSTQSS